MLGTLKPHLPHSLVRLEEKLFGDALVREETDFVLFVLSVEVSRCRQAGTGMCGVNVGPSFGLSYCLSLVSLKPWFDLVFLKYLYLSEELWGEREIERQGGGSVLTKSPHDNCTKYDNDDCNCVDHRGGGFTFRHTIDSLLRSSCRVMMQQRCGMVLRTLFGQRPYLCG